jgi:ribonuclease D
MNYIVTNRKDYFKRIGEYNYCSLEEVLLPAKVAVDTETTSIKPHKGEMFAIQVGTGSDNYLFDLDSIDIKNVISLLENKVLVFHNAKFDLGWFYKYGFFPWKVRDTFLASKILHNGLVLVKHSFGELMSRELKVEYDKSEQKNIAKVKLSTAKAIEYCFNDVDRLLELDTVLNKQIIKGGYLNAYQLHRRHVRALAYMEQCGVPISLKKWKQKTTLEQFLKTTRQKKRNPIIVAL